MTKARTNIYPRLKVQRVAVLSNSLLGVSTWEVVMLDFPDSAPKLIYRGSMHRLALDVALRMSGN